MNPKVQELISKHYWVAVEPGQSIIHLVRQGSEHLRDGVHLFTTACEEYLHLEVLPGDFQVPEETYCKFCLDEVVGVVMADDLLASIRGTKPVDWQSKLPLVWACRQEGSPEFHLVNRQSADPPGEAQFFRTLAGESGEMTATPADPEVPESAYCQDCWRVFMKTLARDGWRPYPFYL